MGYSTAYQDVTAGRVREDEAIGFFGDNLTAGPARVHVSTPVGVNKFPVGKVDYLRHEGAGKPDTVSDVIDTHLPNSYNGNAV
jgi:hypothetical protein